MINTTVLLIHLHIFIRDLSNLHLHHYPTFLGDLSNNCPYHSTPISHAFAGAIQLFFIMCAPLSRLPEFDLIVVQISEHRFPTRERSSYSSQYVHLSRVFPNSTTSWERSVYPSPLSPLSRVSSESTISPNHSAPFSRESVQISSS